MEPSSTLSLQNLWGVLRRHWLVLALSSAALFCAGAMYVFSLQPAYTADTVVLLAPDTEELSDAAASQRPSITDPFFIRSEANIIASEQLAREVIAKLSLENEPEFDLPPGAREGPLDDAELRRDAALRAYSDRLQVFNDGRSKTVSIEFTARTPRLAAAVANAHAEAYLQEQAGRLSQGRGKALEWLKREVDERAREVRDADALLQRYQLQNGIVSTHDATLVEQRLGQLSQQLIEAKHQLTLQGAMLGEIREIRAGGDPMKAATLLENAPLMDLLRSRVQAEAALSSMQSRLADSHPTLVKQRETLASINTTLQTQLARVENEAEASYRASERQVRDLGAAVNGATSEKLGQDKVSSALPALAAEAQVKRTVFETVLRRYQTQLAEQGFSQPTAVIVSRAYPPAQPSYPRKPLFLAIAFIAALMGGAAMTFALHAWRPPSPGLVALADAIGLRALVAIPRFRNTAREPGVVSIRDPRLFIESIRSLRAAVFEPAAAQDLRVCLLTSVVPSQGKTLVAMSLARSLARSGVRTLFLELDLRCPAASTLARLTEASRGVAAVLEARAQITDVLQRDDSTGLDMLLAEANASVSLDRLTSSSIAGLLGKLRTRYDAIVVDGPPVGVINDSLTLARVVDQTLIVARDGESTVSEIAAGVRLLRERGATLAGLVLTDVDPRQAYAARTVSRYVLGMPARIALVKSA
jgi:polysaccharide biosynthesis transport protein